MGSTFRSRSISPEFVLDGVISLVEKAWLSLVVRELPSILAEAKDLVAVLRLPKEWTMSTWFNDGGTNCCRKKL